MKWMIVFKVLLLGVLVVLSGCKQDDIVIVDEQGPIGLAGPAVRFNLSVFDFVEDLEKEDVFVDEEGVLFFQYRESVFINWENLVTLRDVNERWSYPLPVFASSLKASSAEPLYSEQVVLSHQDDVRYDSLALLHGELDLSVEVPTGLEGFIMVEIPQATTGSGEVLRVYFEVDAFGNVTSQQMPLSLVDFFIEFDNAAEEPYNSHIDINIYPDLSLTGIPTGGELALNFSLTGLKKKSAYGYFGDQTATREDAEVEFGIFEEVEDLAAHFELADFELDIDIFNRIGVPFYVEASNIRFFQADSETPDSYLIIDNENRAVIDYIPNALETEPLTPGEAEFNVSGSTSNLIEIGNTFPVRVMVDLFSRSNPPAPEGVEADKDNFMLEVEELQADMVFKLPLWFRVTDYARTDTIEFDFLDIINGSEEEVDHIEMAKIFFDFESSIPLNIWTTAWVIDAQGNKIDDLLESNTYIIRSGTTESPVESAFEIGLTGEQIRLFKNRAAKQIVLSYFLSSGDADSDPVKITRDAALKGLVSFDLSGNIPN